MSRDGVTCCGSWPTGYEKRTLKVFGSMTEIVFPIEFGTYTRSGIDCRRGRMLPVAAAYTLTFEPVVCAGLAAGELDLPADEDAGLFELPAPVGVAFPAEHAVA